MKNFKQLGIYMDHAHAFLMELENGMILSRNIVSGWKETEEKAHCCHAHSYRRIAKRC